MHELRRSLAPAGPGHERVRRFLAVKKNRGPDRTGAFALEGLWMIRAARRGGGELDVAFVCVDLLRGEESYKLVEELVDEGVETYSVSARVLTRMVGRDGPDGLVALCHRPVAVLADLSPARQARCLVVDSAELPGNLGSLIRCADAVGCCAVLVTDCRVRMNHPLVLKASMGAVFSVPVLATGRTTALGWLRTHGFHVLAADPAGRTRYVDAAFPDRVAVVLGSERYGLSSFWREEAHERVSIPMLGSADSLNVGHAGAVLLYETLGRQAGAPGRRSRRLR